MMRLLGRLLRRPGRVREVAPVVCLLMNDVRCDIFGFR